MIKNLMTQFEQHLALPKLRLDPTLKPFGTFVKGTQECWQSGGIAPPWSVP